MERDDEGSLMRGGIPPQQAGGGRRPDPTQDVPDPSGDEPRNPDATDEAREASAAKLGSVGPSTTGRPKPPGQGAGAG